MPDVMVLKTIPLFAHLSEAGLAHLQSALTERSLSAGEGLFEMGDAGDEMFIVRTGRVAIYMPDREAPAREQPIRIFESGQVLGEMALIDRQPRSLSARALEPTWVWVLNGEDFRQLLAAHPELALSVMHGLSDRIRYTTEFLNEVRTWVQRIAAGKYERAVSTSREYADPSVAALAAEFSQMAAQVQLREEALRQEVLHLQIEIDESKRKRHVEEITGTDYFQSLQQQARRLRTEKDEE